MGNANSGRKAKPIDREKIFEMASKAATNLEIAEECGVSHDTLTRRAKNELRRGRLLRDRSIRQKQYEMAMGGNATLLVFLGKVLLGQVERQEISGPNGGPIEYSRADLARLTDDELAELERLVESACDEGRAKAKYAPGKGPQAIQAEPLEPRPDPQ